MLRFGLVVRVALCSLSIVAMCACGAGNMPQAMQTVPNSVRADRHSSWMAPGAAKHDLLYVADASDVTVYTYPDGKLVGRLKDDFVDPATECSDKAGDVFITGGASGSVYEYAHAGTRPLRILRLAAAVTGCAADPTSGDLAVTYDVSIQSKSYIAIYKHARGTPTLYQYGKLVFYRCGYDPDGNLYADGRYNRGGRHPGFVELPKGGDALKRITLNQSFNIPLDVQWDGTYMTFGDGARSNRTPVVIDRFKFSGTEGTLVGKTSLDNGHPTFNWWIAGNAVVAGLLGESSAVKFWSYPAGGSPTKSVTKGVSDPEGVTISRASS